MDRGNNNRGRGRGGGRGGGGGRGRGDHQEQSYQQQSPNQGGRGGPRGPPQGSGGRPAGQPWGPRPVQPQQGGAAYRAPPPVTPGVAPPRPQPVPSPAVVGRGAWGSGPPMVRPGGVPARPEVGETSAGGRGGGRGAWGTGGRGGWGPPASPAPDSPAPAPVQPQKAPSSPAVVPDIVPDMQSLQISGKSPAPSSSGGELVPVRRPDNGGTLSIQTVKLLVNHFAVNFNPNTVVIHYDVDIKKNTPPNSRPAKIPKALLRMIKDKLFADGSSQFPSVFATSYDGEKNIFSAVVLPTGKFTVEFSEGEDARSASYTITIQEVKRLEFGKVKKYLSGELLSIPRDILQAMDLVMKENPTKQRIMVGRSFYGKSYRREDDIEGGVAASKGFYQSLKPTAQGLSLCLDYSVLAFYKKLPVLDFLKESIRNFNVNDMRRLKNAVAKALIGLKVTVTHRRTKQKYTISGLTDKDTNALWFDVEDPEGNAPPEKVSLVEYFRKKYNKDIVHKNIPCLNVGRGGRVNYVPMEFCVLAEGQRYQKENLSRDGAALLKNMSLAHPKDRMRTIDEMVHGQDGPGGNVSENFGIELLKNMTRVDGRVIEPPQLKLGGPNGRTTTVRVDADKRQWNLVGKSVLDGRRVDRWGLMDFTMGSRSQLDVGRFVNNLRSRCHKLGMEMAEPMVYGDCDMSPFNNINDLQHFLEWTVSEAEKNHKAKLQIIICVMADKSDGYKHLKWLSETKIGVVTQCCLAFPANKGNDQYLANLALKINAKIGGSNQELVERLPRFEGDAHVMFIGADVNHPAARNTTCPSIAAVVGSVNWPSATRYAARVSPQYHRKEKIVNFGEMCLELIQTYAQLNKARPQRIVVFRDGVSEGQFDMVLNEELLDMKRTICSENYRPTITLVVAQKRHQTRLFPQTPKDGGQTGNVPPGTVVDKVITHPFEFDFYLCSHYGGIGTSKPTHYYVLWDEHKFTSNQLQKLIYNMCFTFARCTKPVSLVPPVYYADLVAYRGRMFQEVMMDVNPQAANSATNLNESFYQLHPDLKDIMFFV